MIMPQGTAITTAVSALFQAIGKLEESVKLILQAADPATGGSNPGLLLLIELAIFVPDLNHQLPPNLCAFALLRH
jgi:hypothetical protein